LIFLFSGASPWNSDGADGYVGRGFRTVLAFFGRLGCDCINFMI
jgi:hypothetical protein